MNCFTFTVKKIIEAQKEGRKWYLTITPGESSRWIPHFICSYTLGHHTQAVPKKRVYGFWNVAWALLTRSEEENWLIKEEKGE